jgi:hypothetical protein
MDPRQLEIPARQLAGSFQGANLWCVRAADPMSHKIGCWPRITRQQRNSLSRAQFPICVAVVYRMLFMSNKIKDPMSERSSAAATFPALSLLSLAKSTRCSQSVPSVAPGEAIGMDCVVAE